MVAAFWSIASGCPPLFHFASFSYALPLFFLVPARLSDAVSYRPLTRFFYHFPTVLPFYARVCIIDDTGNKFTISRYKSRGRQIILRTDGIPRSFGIELFIRNV